MLLQQSAPTTATRIWVALPEMSDDAIRVGTGKGWDEWADLIDEFPGRADGHKGIADHVNAQFGIGGWWAQAVTVGYERIAGLRLPHQMADGTFTANKSRTVTVDRPGLRRLLLDDTERSDLFPGMSTELRSRPTAKAIRIAIGPGVAVISLDDAGGARTKIAVQHSRLPDFDDVEQWKFYWSDWLDAIDDVGSDT